MSTHPPLVLLANARVPSHRAQSLQVVQMAAAFQRAGASTTLLHAQRSRVVALPATVDVWTYYAVADGERPSIAAIPCLDWIDRVPRVLQYVPARLQEQSFARAAAERVLRDHSGARVLSREAESARALLKKGHEDVFLEIHRVPGGRVRRRWLAEAAAGARGTVAISGGVRDDLVSLGVAAERVRVEHDGFESSRFAALPDRAAARKELGLPAEAPLAVYTGGLMDWKGVDVLVAAARALPHAYFVIAGGMEADVKKLRHAAGGASNVRIDGFQPPARIASYLAAADVGVVPNRAEPAISSRYTSPLKVFEAMAAGLPLVASDVPALREILGHERDALLVPPGDSEELARALARLFEDGALRERLARSMKARAAEHDWDARARRILAWMEGYGVR